MNRDDRQRGFALVSVLWAATLLAIIAASILMTGRTSAKLSRNLSERAQLDAAAEAGIYLAIQNLLQTSDKRPRVDGTPYHREFETYQITIFIQDETGEIDINYASGELLAGLLHSAGLSYDDARSEADKIEDWREPLPTKRLNGAKAEDYAAAGIAYGPRGRPFQSVEELQLVMGMTRELFQRVSPALTVYSQRATFDPTLAPKEALLALPGMDPEKADAFLAARTNGDPDRQDEQFNVSDSLRFDMTGKAFSIAVRAQNDRGSAVSREAVIRLTGNIQRPYWILLWR
jgi:general secretion pathway protein K